MKFNNTKTNNVIVAEQTFIDGLSDTLDWVQIEEPVIVPRLEEVKSTKQAQLLTYVNKQKKLFEAPYSKISVESFVDKRKEALAYAIDNTVPTPYIDMLSTDSVGAVNTAIRDALLIAILGKVSAIAQLEAFEDATRTAIKSATTQTELNLVVI